MADFRVSALWLNSFKSPSPTPVGGVFLAQATRGNYENSWSYFNVPACLDLTLGGESYRLTHSPSALRAPSDSRNSQCTPGGQGVFTDLLPPSACREGPRHTEAHQHRSRPSPVGPQGASGRWVSQLVASVGDPLVLSEVAQSSAEAADFLHMGLRHPPPLTVSQAHALQPT